MDVTYRQMAEMLRGLSAEGTFPDLHHRASGMFAGKLPSLEEFCRYCGGVSNLQAEGENRQTIRRAVAFVEQRRQGVPDDEALKAAWKLHPLATR